MTRFRIECPTGSGKMMNLWEVAMEVSRRLVSVFLRNAAGRRPVYGGTETFQTDPRWRDYILFYEYFHGDNGAGLGASHQTGWTGVVAHLVHLLHLDSKDVLRWGRVGAFLAGGRGPSRGVTVARCGLIPAHFAKPVLRNPSIYSRAGTELCTKGATKI